MNRPAPELTPQCPRCGAQLAATDVCWLCRAELEADEIAQARQQNSELPSAAPPQFTLASLLLAMTYVGVLCGLFAFAPGFAVIVALVTAPAFIRTAVVAQHARQAGRPRNAGDKFVLFLGTTSFVVVLLIAMGVAFFCTCFVAFWAGAYGHELINPSVGLDSIGTGFAIGIPLGIIVAGIVMWQMIRWAVKWWT